MRIALAGEGPFCLNAFNSLLGSSHEIVALLANGRKQKGVARQIRLMHQSIFRPFSLYARARRNGIPVLYIDRMDEKELEPLRKIQPELLLVAGFGVILKRPILDIPTIGCVNCHSSLLPRHRGPNPFAAVIRAGEVESAITFHIITEGIDDGDIIAQFPFPLTTSDTLTTVYNRCGALLAEQTVPLIDKIEREGLQGVPQDPVLASYDPNPSDDAFVIDWTLSSEELDRRARAYAAMRPLRFRYRNRYIYVFRLELEPEPVTAPPGTVLNVHPVPQIATGQGSIRIRTACVIKPFPWVWPGLFNSLKPGDNLIS